MSQFYRYFSFVFQRDKNTKQNLQVLYFSAFLSIAIMHQNSMPVSVFQLALTSLGSKIRDILKCFSGAMWTEPMKRNAFQRKRHVSKATPQITHLLIYQSCT